MNNQFLIFYCRHYKNAKVEILQKEIAYAIMPVGKNDVIKSTRTHPFPAPV